MMDFSRKFKALAAVNSLLLLLIAAGLVFSPSGKLDRSERRVLVSDKIEIMSVKVDGSKSVTLEKNGNSWMLLRGSERLPADASRISAFLDALKGVKRLEIVSKARDTWKDFGLEGPQARRVRLFDAANKIIADFTIGNYSSASSDVYITFPESETAYKASAAFVSYLEGGDASWLNLKLLPAMDLKSIDSFDVRGSLEFDEKTVVKADYSLVRDQTGWKTAIPGTESLDTVKVETMLRSLLSAKGEDFAAPGTQLGEVRATLTLNMGSGEKIVVAIGAIGGDKRFPVKTGAGERVTYVASWALREAFKPMRDLLR